MAPLGSAGVREGSLRPCQLTPRMGAPGFDGAPLPCRGTTGPPAVFADPWLGAPCVLTDGTVPGRRRGVLVPAPATVAEPTRPRVSRALPNATNARVLTRTPLRDSRTSSPNRPNPSFRSTSAQSPHPTARSPVDPVSGPTAPPRPSSAPNPGRHGAGPRARTRTPSPP